MSILSVLKRRGNTQGELQDSSQPPTTSPEPSLPPLILLSSDAAGPSVRRLHRFPDAEAAADHIDFWFPVSQRHGMTAFWALPNPPIADPNTENKGGADSHRASAESASPTEPRDQIIVIVQHPDYEDSVYPFSFPDLRAANRFVLQELKSGLDLRSVHIYWASFVDISAEPNGAVTLTPSQPPAARSIAWSDPHTTPEPEVAPDPVPVPDITHTPVAAREPTPAPVAAPEPTPETARQSQPALARDPIAAYQPPNEPTTLNEIIRDLARVLDVGRPDEPSGAFQGFGSPPGRF